MNRNKRTINYGSIIIYELRNICGNPYVHLFGILMPTLLVILFSGMIGNEVPQEYQRAANTSLFGGIAMVIPLAIILLGCAATSAQEIEKKIPLRFKLFGFSEKRMIISRFVAEMILATIALVIYSIVCCLTVKVAQPVWWALLIWLLCFYLLCGIMYMLAYGLASIIKKFGATYCISMILYFGAMILSGMMGASVEQMPEGVQKVSRMLPTTYIFSDLMEFWEGGNYNFMPLAQSFLFVGAASGIILYFAVYKTRRVLK